MWTGAAHPPGGRTLDCVRPPLVLPKTGNSSGTGRQAGRLWVPSHSVSHVECCKDLVSDSSSTRTQVEQAPAEEVRGRLVLTYKLTV